MKTQSLKLKTSTLIAAIFLLATVREASAQVVINEMSTYETSGDWVELFSPDDIDISGWILRDGASSLIETIPQGVSIGPSTSKYYVIEAGNRLNRESDTIKILKSDDLTLVDEVDYGGTDQICAPGSGESIGRYPDGNNTRDRFSVITKNSTNNAATLNPCPTPSPTPIATNSPTPTSTPSPTPSRSPTPSPTKTLTPKPTPTPNKETESPTSEPDSSVASVLGTESTEILEPTPSSKPQGSGNTLLLGIPLIAAGGGLLIGSSFVAYKKYKKDGIIKDDESKEI